MQSKLLQDKEEWSKLVENAMNTDNSWNKSAKEYNRYIWRHMNLIKGGI